MPDRLYIGIDGGGSQCRARIRDDAGRLLGEGAGGPANVFSDFAKGLRSIRSAALAAISAAALDERDIGHMHAGLGVAGAGTKESRDRVRDLDIPFSSMVVGTDAYIAWLGAHEGQDGAVVSLGTGSSGLGRRAGRWYYVGGWGLHISDDAGGQAIGREALRRALWAFDDLISPTPLSEAILARFDRQPRRIVAFARAAGAPEFARFAPLVFEHAQAGDPTAVAIVSAVAEHAADMVRRFKRAGIDAVSLVGGLSTPIAPWLPREITDALVAPRRDALDGAILMARGQSPA